MAIEKNINQATSLLELIKKGDPKTLKKLYDENRKPFIGWANQFYQADEEDAIEIFQKAFTIFYFNVKDAKLVELTSSVKTYLYSMMQLLVPKSTKRSIPIFSMNTKTIISATW